MTGKVLEVKIQCYGMISKVGYLLTQEKPGFTKMMKHYWFVDYTLGNYVVGFKPSLKGSLLAELFSQLIKFYVMR